MSQKLYGTTVTRRKASTKGILDRAECCLNNDGTDLKKLHPLTVTL